MIVDDTPSAPSPPLLKLKSPHDLDEILAQLGRFGPYQKKLLTLILIPVSFFAAFTMNLLLFQMVVPDHWCYIPGRENTSHSVAEWQNLTIPRSNVSGKLSSCSMYEAVWIDDAKGSDGDINDGDSNINATTVRYTITHNTKECSEGWEYDQTHFTSTVATSLNWVCDHYHYSHHTLSVSMAGNAVGTLLLPILADKYLGRRPVFYISLAIHIVLTVPLLWVTNAVLHMALRFLQGLYFETCYLMPYVIYMEVIPPEQRALAVMLSFIGWTLGMCFTALVAWLLPLWDYLAIISIIPSILGFFYWRILPESPRWLLAKGKIHQCADVLMEISAANGTRMCRGELEDHLRVLMARQPVDQPLTTVMNYPKLRLRTLAIISMSFMSFLIYGVTMLSMSVFSNEFLAHFVLSIFELPSNFIGCLITHFLGRRFMAYSNYLLLAIFCFAAPFCVHNEWLLMTVIGFAKLFSTSALYVVFLMVNEVLPTPIRTAGTGLTVVFGMIGMVLAPHVLHYGGSDGSHYWILLGLTLASTLTMIPLPETLGLQLPQTFQDAEDLGSDRPITTWIHHWNFNRFMPSPPLIRQSDTIKEKEDEGVRESLIVQKPT